MSRPDEDQIERIEIHEIGIGWLGIPPLTRQQIPQKDAARWPARLRRPEPSQVRDYGKPPFLRHTQPCATRLPVLASQDMIRLVPSLQPSCRASVKLVAIACHDEGPIRMDAPRQC